MLLGLKSLNQQGRNYSQKFPELSQTPLAELSTVQPDIAATVE